ncbi:peptidase M10A [Actinokineospora sp. NBRC 105648]|uniref:peptidase M10A n=1 Tax=Actinokineospora sp. NBRC 105648 TaxID=3032206 RepID=UPI0024A14327|nr:peptidase M10A [Actinokineospora sp. NBRC 105648]GLZ38813.1 hypothetical protein Acsp05_24370 [Actinokineospora sp. NBRC 105648]
MRRSPIVTLAAVALAATAVVAGGQPAPAPEQDQVRVVGHGLTISEIPEAHLAALAAQPVDTACTDATYAVKTWKVSGTWTWLYNPEGAPAAVKDTALAAITTAGDTVAKGVNRCGLAANFTTVYKYGGTSTVKPQVSADLTCTGNDGKSVSGWGALPPKVLAYTCTYFNSKNVVIASDMLIDNVAYTWFTTKPDNCAGQLYDLETTMAHERLHTAGLAHVDQTKNAAQTMTPASAPCDTSRRLLGAGDYAGLKSLAGK